MIKHVTNDNNSSNNNSYLQLCSHFPLKEDAEAERAVD